jgi:hypothetical protein
VVGNRTSVGLDVHARSVVACGLDGRTGELFDRRLTPDHQDIVSWLRALPGPVAVTYEAGPTGFGLARERVFYDSRNPAPQGCNGALTPDCRECVVDHGDLCWKA